MFFFFILNHKQIEHFIGFTQDKDLEVCSPKTFVVFLQGYCWAISFQVYKFIKSESYLLYLKLKFSNFDLQYQRRGQWGRENSQKGGSSFLPLKVLEHSRLEETVWT
jgi:hypothetical protein